MDAEQAPCMLCVYVCRQPSGVLCCVCTSETFMVLVCCAVVGVYVLGQGPKKAEGFCSSPPHEMKGSRWWWLYHPATQFQQHQQQVRGATTTTRGLPCCGSASCCHNTESISTSAAQKRVRNYLVRHFCMCSCPSVVVRVLCNTCCRLCFTVLLHCLVACGLCCLLLACTFPPSLGGRRSNLG